MLPSRESQTSSRALVWTVKLIVIFLFLGAVAAGTVTANLKSRSLDFHSRDYAFYAQFAARLLNPDLTNRYALQPVGYNFLGLVGTEGVYSFHQSLHLEPIKYAYAPIHQVFGGILPVFAIVVAAYFLPVLYLIFCDPGEKNVDLAFALLAALLYLLYPSALETATYDLRPRLLLAAFFALAMLAVIYRRGLWEKVLAFGLMFLAREEALVYGPVVIAFNYVRTKDKKRRHISTTALGAIWMIALSVTYWYFDWTGYAVKPDINRDEFIRLTPGMGLLILAVGLVMGVIFIVATRKRERFPIWAQILAYGAVFVPLGVQTFSDARRLLERGYSRHEVFERVLLSPQMNTYLIVPLWILLVVLWQAIPRHRLRVWFNLGLGLLLIYCVRINLHYMPPRYDHYVQAAGAAEIVFETRQATDQNSSHILTDYVTYQAFYDYEHALAYNRLPTDLFKGEQRYYPKNVETVKTLLADEVEYVVISESSERILGPLLAEVAITPLERRADGGYVVIKLR